LNGENDLPKRRLRRAAGGVEVERSRAAVRIIQDSFSDEMSFGSLHHFFSMKTYQLCGLFALLLAGGAAPSWNAQQEKGEVGANADVKTLVTCNNEFALDMYKRLAQGEKGNIIFSPYSISSALAMTYVGARGQTAEEMAKVLHFSLSEERLHPASKELTLHLLKDDESRGCELRVANALWGQVGLPLLPAFLDVIRSNYRAGLLQVDFANAPEESRKFINNWVEVETNEKIKELLREEDITKLTRLVLTNAIYFKGKWKMPFLKDATKDEVFEVAPDKRKTVPMMHHKEGIFGYLEDENFQWLELPYQADRFSMILLLPKKQTLLGDLEQPLTAAALKSGIDLLSYRKGSVVLPKFTITWHMPLRDQLMGLGMKLAFSPEADFSGITGKRGLIIADVIHKAFIDVDERGTEAAAATGVLMLEGKTVPFTFVANHPFVFLIRDRDTSSILFLGRVTDPSAPAQKDKGLRR
jgi:serine protease inhibitor